VVVGGIGVVTTGTEVVASGVGDGTDVVTSGTGVVTSGDAATLNELDSAMSLTPEEFVAVTCTTYC